jgi:hypothetical protein
VEITVICTDRDRHTREVLGMVDPAAAAPELPPPPSGYRVEAGTTSFHKAAASHVMWWDDHGTFVFRCSRRRCKRNVPVRQERLACVVAKLVGAGMDTLDISYESTWNC